MLHSRPIRPTLLILLFTAIAAPSAQAMVEVGFGNEPVGDRSWRVGSRDVANLPTRFGYWNGGLLEVNHFLYRGNSQQFTEALTLFAKIRAPLLELYVHDGPYEDPY